MNQAASILRALAVPSRMGVYQALGASGAAVGRVAQDLGLAQATVSHHLKVLKRAGLIEMRIHGRQHIYRRRGLWYLVQGASEESGR